MIFVDTNHAENSLFEQLKMLLEEESVGRKPLVIGDVLIEDDENNAVFSFEVKRGNDWGASILDGRLKNQRARAKDSELCGKFNYIYEGKMPNSGMNNNDVMRNGLSDAAIYGSIVRTSLRDGLFVFKTENTAETAELLARVFRDFQKNRFSQVDKPGIVAPAKRKRAWAETNPVQNALLSVPGVGLQAAEALASKYGGLIEILQASTSEIAEVRMKNEKRVGIAKAKKIKNLC